jgi:asparagine synthase (glutamine-hydrolysing)
VDSETGNYVIARDAIGINPLYYMCDGNYKLYISSELKSLSKIQVGQDKSYNLWFSEIREFLPGSFMSSCDPFKLKKWYQPIWLVEPTSHKHVNPDMLADHSAHVSKKLMELLENAVVKMMMSDVPFGVLLSGGLDSSVVASLVVKHSKMRVETDSKEEAWYPRIHTFAVGMKDSPDLKYAREVAHHLGTAHHEIIFTAEEILESLSDVIYYTETYDITTIRASSAMMYLSKKIKSMGFKMVLSGEGSDEIFAGYLYNHWAPNADELHVEAVRKVSKLHLYDCLRANKSMCAWSIECRPPFLDKELVNYVMEEIDPELKMIYPGHSVQHMEKGLLRNAFQTYCADHLPESVLWRVKEQFSDGVGKGHIDALKNSAEQRVTDEMMANARSRFPINTPYTKEHYLYRSIFEEHYPSKLGQPELCPPHEKSIACSSQTALKWKAEWSKQWDPSGKTNM